MGYRATPTAHGCEAVQTLRALVSATLGSAQTETTALVIGGQDKLHFPSWGVFMAPELVAPSLFFNSNKYKVIGPPVPTPRIHGRRQDHPSRGKSQLIHFMAKLGKEGEPG